MPIKEFSARFKSKRECYNFLTLDCKAYLPSAEHVTGIYCRELIDNTKGMIKADAIKHLTLPHYESIALPKILAWARQQHRAVVDRHLPSLQREVDKLPRQVSSLGSNQTPGLLD